MQAVKNARKEHKTNRDQFEKNRRRNGDDDDNATLISVRSAASAAATRTRTSNRSKRTAQSKTKPKKKKSSVSKLTSLVEASKPARTAPGSKGPSLRPRRSTALLEAGKSTAAKTSKERVDMFRVHSTDFKTVMQVLASRSEGDPDAVTMNFVERSETADTLVVVVCATKKAELVNDVLAGDGDKTYAAAVAVVEAGHEIYRGNSTAKQNFLKKATIIHEFAVNPNFEGRGYGRKLVETIGDCMKVHPERYGSVAVVVSPIKGRDTPPVADGFGQLGTTSLRSSPRKAASHRATTNHRLPPKFFAHVGFVEDHSPWFVYDDMPTGSVFLYANADQLCAKLSEDGNRRRSGWCTSTAVFDPNAIHRIKYDSRSELYQYSNGFIDRPGCGGTLHDVVAKTLHVTPAFLQRLKEEPNRDKWVEPPTGFKRRDDNELTVVGMHPYQSIVDTNTGTTADCAVVSVALALHQCNPSAGRRFYSLYLSNKKALQGLELFSGKERRSSQRQHLGSVHGFLQGAKIGYQMERPKAIPKLYGDRLEALMTGKYHGEVIVARLVNHQRVASHVVAIDCRQQCPIVLDPFENGSWMLTQEALNRCCGLHSICTGVSEMALIRRQRTKAMDKPASRAKNNRYKKRKGKRVSNPLPVQLCEEKSPLAADQSSAADQSRIDEEEEMDSSPVCDKNDLTPCEIRNLLASADRSREKTLPL